MKGKGFAFGLGHLTFWHQVWFIDIRNKWILEQNGLLVVSGKDHANEEGTAVDKEVKMQDAK